MKLHIACFAIVMLSSRPKHVCKSLADEALVLLDEENKDIFEYATNTDKDEEGDDLPQEDDLLEVDQLEVIYSESEISDEEEPEMDDSSFVSTCGRILASQKSYDDTKQTGKVRHLE